MREIRFRGKSIKSKDWVYGAYVMAMDEDSLDSIIDVNNGEWRLVRSDTVGQFTGLRDKNGREIYEGDVIEVISSEGKSIRHDVRYSGHYGGYIQAHGIDECGLLNQHYISECGKYVIGNVHDNSELLKN